MLCVQVEKKRGESEAEPEDDAGCDIPALHALDPDNLHDPGGEDARSDEPDQLRDAEKERRRPADRAEVGESMSGKRLSAQNGENTDQAGDGRDQRSDHQGQLHGSASEECVHSSCSWMCSSPATTRTRPSTRITSTRRPYNLVSTLDCTTSSVVPATA